MKQLSTYLLLVILSISTVHCFTAEKNNDTESCYSAEELTFDQCESTMLNFDSEIDMVRANLSDEQKNDLIYMWQEEKLARDVYITMATKYNLNKFNNIARSEQKHMDAVKSKIDKYNISMQGMSSAVGVFSDPQFNQLYNDLITEGNVSLENALKVGVKIEELDIADLEERIQRAEGDVLKMFNNLLQASQRHLEAFKHICGN